MLSLLVKSSSASPSTWKKVSPSERSTARAARKPAPAGGAGSARISGMPSGAPDHDQVLRNQRCGKRWSGAAAGPRLSTVIAMRMSLGPRLAYSTVTSK